MRRWGMMLAIVAGVSISAIAQQDSTAQTVMTNVIVAQRSVVLTNVGQANHLLIYCITTDGNALNQIQIELDASFNATKKDGTDGTWFPITAIGQDNTAGCHVMETGGYFTSLTVNLLTMVPHAPGAFSVTVYYSGTKGPLTGSYNANANQSSNNGLFPGTGVVLYGHTQFTGTSGAFTPFPFYMNQISRRALTEGIQQPGAFESWVVEQVSAANTANTVTIPFNGSSPPTLLSVNARCSAGTAQLTVNQTAVGPPPTNATIYSTASTEVGTTSFFRDWKTGLRPGGPQNAHVVGSDCAGVACNLVVSISTCGGGNTSTLDVQAIYPQNAY